VTPHDFPTVFPHEPTPFTAHTPTTSASRILKASSLTPMTSILKQGKRDARSYRSGSVPKWSRRHGWRCSLQTHATNPNVVSRQTAGLSKRGEYKTRDMKPPTAPSSEWGVSRVQKKNKDDGKRVRMKLMSNVYAVGVCSVRTTTKKNGFDTKLSEMGICVWQVQEMTDTCFLWPPSAMENLILWY